MSTEDEKEEVQSKSDDETGALLGTNTPGDDLTNDVDDTEAGADAAEDDAVDNEPKPGEIVKQDPFGANVELETVDSGHYAYVDEDKDGAKAPEPDDE